jgi:predicted dehydrogenase
MSKIKTIIIGCGRTAHEFHKPVLLKHPEFEVVGVYDTVPENAKSIADVFNCKIYASAEDYLSSGEYEFAIVLTTSHVHTPISCDLLKRGKKVLITKPWSMNVGEADLLNKLAKEHNTLVIPWLPNHWSKDWKKIRELIDAGKIGKLYQIERNQYTFGKRSDWQTLKECGGGYLNNWGPHLVQMLCDFLGEPITQVSCNNMRQVVNPGNTEDSFEAVMLSKSGVIVNVSHMFSTDYLPNWIARGSEGTIYGTTKEIELHQVRHGPQDPMLYRNPFTVEKSTYPVTQYDTFEIYSHIAETLRGKVPYDVTFEFARHVTEVIDALHQSSANNEIVKIR